MKKIIMTVVSVLCCLFLWTATADAASVKSSYTMKKGSYVKDKTLTVKSRNTKTVTLNVKEKGTLKIAATKVSSSKFTGKEQLTVKLVNSKGKTVKTTYVKKNEEAYIKADVSKGTYKVKVSTKNVKKNASKKVNFGCTLNKEIVVNDDEKTTYDVTNKKGQMSFKLVNSKSQTLRICVGKDGDVSYKDQIVVKDTKGNVVYTDKGGIDHNWDFFYLAKGTYQVSYTGDISRVQSICVKTSKEFTENLVLDPATKANAAEYTGKRLNLVNSTKKPASLWMKIDTSKNAYAFNVRKALYSGGDDVDMASGSLYREDGSVLLEDEPFEETIKMLKGTGVYYLEVYAPANRVITISQSNIVCIVTANKKTTFMKNSDGRLEVTSDANKIVEGSFDLLKESYVVMKTTVFSDGELIAIYDETGKRVPADADGLSKLKAGTYHFKANVSKANKWNELLFKIYQVSTLTKNKMAYTENKSVTFTLDDLKVDQVYKVNVGHVRDKEKPVVVSVYENGKKLVEQSKENTVYVHAKAKKTYKVVVTSAEDTLVYYKPSAWGDLSASYQKLTATKKAAVTYKSTDKKNFIGSILLNGKSTGWMKITNTSKKDIFLNTDTYINKGKGSIEYYNSKGQLKKTCKVARTTTSSTWKGSCKLSPNESCYVKISSTDKNSHGYVRIKATEY